MQYFFEYEVMNLETKEVLAQCEFEAKLTEEEVKAFDHFFTWKISLTEEEWEAAGALREKILDVAEDMESQNTEWDDIRDKIVISIICVRSEDNAKEQEKFEEEEEKLRKTMERVGTMKYGDGYTLTDKAMERNRRCQEVNAFLDVMDAIDMLPKRGVKRSKSIYRVPLRYEALSVVMAMAHAYGAATEEEVKAFCNENVRDPENPDNRLGMNEKEILELSSQLQEHFEQRCEYMDERLKELKSKHKEWAKNRACATRKPW